MITYAVLADNGSTAAQTPARDSVEFGPRVRDVKFAAAGTFDSGSFQLEMQDGTNWYAVGTALTAAGVNDVKVVEGRPLRVTAGSIAGAASTVVCRVLGASAVAVVS
jgi:hypothetical protein